MVPFKHYLDVCEDVKAPLHALLHTAGPSGCPAPGTLGDAVVAQGGLVLEAKSVQLPSW